MSAHRATVAGGWRNEASSDYATVGGGTSNHAAGRGATIPGGAGNTADGRYSFAAGREAYADGHDGAFVFGDSSSTSIQALNDDEIRSQMPIYAPSINPTSARAAKTDVEPVDPADVLAGVESLDVATWTFTHSDDDRHMGPMAEEFADVFGLGSDDGSIATVDADGVALAAIQGLADTLEEASDRIEDTAAENATLREATGTLREQNASLRDRLDALEARVDRLADESSATDD